MPSLIPIEIVTGFLGSGKTTLIQHLISSETGGQRIAVIVNDLAEYNIDGQILKTLNVDRMVTLTNGCVCCSGIYQLGSALQEIVDAADPSLILIETSGASAPGPVVAELANLGYATDAVITVLDAEQFPSLLASEPVAAEQVREADFLVLNKLDLSDPVKIAKTKSSLGRLNGRARLLESTFGRVRTDLILATGVSKLRKRPPAGSESAVGHSHAASPRNSDEIEHFSAGLAGPVDLKSFRRFLDRLPEAVYRAKGFLRFDGDPHPRLLNYVCGRYTLEPFPLPSGLSNDRSPSNQVVFIGRNISRLQERLKASMARCAAGTERPSMISRILGG